MKTPGSSEAPCPILLDPKLMNPSQPTLWWCLDAEDVFAVGENAVCKAGSVSWAEVEQSEALSEIVGLYEFVLVGAPPGPERDELVEHLTAFLYTPVLVPTEKAFRGHANVRELLRCCGTRAVDALLYGAQEVPMQGVLDLAEVEASQGMDAQRVLSGFRELDAGIGGFSPGELSVWTGKRGEGKSTLLSQLLLEAVNQGRRVCAYSGELPARQFKLTMLQQAAGRDGVERREDARSGRVFFDVKPETAQRVNEWWRRRLFLTDIKRDNCHDERQILKAFEYARRRYGCDVFLVDNIMTAQLKDAAALGYWQAQSAFTGRLAAFAKGRGVHVHLVAHPRKTNGRLAADDVGGSVDITNRADNVLRVERVPEENLEKSGCNMLLSVLKNREFGAMPKIKLDFDPETRRFYPAGTGNGRAYSWERAERAGHSLAAELHARGKAIKAANRARAQAEAERVAQAAGEQVVQAVIGHLDG